MIVSGKYVKLIGRANDDIKADLCFYRGAAFWQEAAETEQHAKEARNMNDERVSIRIVEEGDAGYPDVVMRSVEHKEKYSLMQLTMGDKDVVLVPLFQVLDQISERKTGRWVSEIVEREDWRGIKRKYFHPNSCSVCHEPSNIGEEYPYCPHCGAKMERSEKDAEL